MTASPTDSEKVTVYLLAAQVLALDELVLKLRKLKIYTNRSELLRLAVTLLLEQKLEQITNRLKR